MVHVSTPHRVVRTLVCAALFGITLMTGTSAKAQVNIIQIIADDLSWVDLSSNLANLGNASTYYQTPNIDRLADEGISFTSAYAIQNCEPTRATVFTGQYPTRTGVHNVDGLNRGSGILTAANDLDHIEHNAITLGETLQSNGYRTAHVGKFHASANSGDITTFHGFDVNIGGNETGSPDQNYHADGSGVFDNRVSSSMDTYGTPYTQQYVDDNLAPYATGNNPDVLWQGGDQHGDRKHLTDATVDGALDFMDTEVTAGNPFFVNVGFHAVHTPINNNVARDDLDTKWNGISSSDPRHSNNNYAAILEGMDQGIARLYDFVHDPNGDGNTADSIANNTVIVFTSDNGGHEGPTDNAPLKGRKGSQDEGGIRVPMIFWAPGIIDAADEGTTYDNAVHVVDLYQTYAELTGSALPDSSTHPVDGESLAGFLDGSKTELERDSIFFHFPGYLDSRSKPTSTINRRFGNEQVKLMYFYEEQQYSEDASYAGDPGAFLMFNLNADIGEANNLADGSLSGLDFKRGARAAWDLNKFLNDTNAIYPKFGSSGPETDTVHHTPRMTFETNETAQGAAFFDGNTSVQITENDITLTLTAIGSNAVLDANETGVGVDSDLDSGDASTVRRVDGTLSTPEALHFSFDEDVLLKSILVGALSTNGSESMRLDFVSGDNPFAGLTGYSGSYVVTSNSLTYTTSSGAATPLLVEFGMLQQEEILITAGTTLAFSGNPATGGGILFDSISVALAIDNIQNYLLDFDESDTLDAGDIDAVYAGLGNAALDVDLDGDADQADVDELVRVHLHTEYGDANLDYIVNPTDLAALTLSWLGPGGWANGDFDGNGVVNPTDLALLTLNWLVDNTPDDGDPGTGGGGIPEPTTALLLGLGAMALVRRRVRS